ncbi:separin (caspase fold protease) [Cryptosporidium xiaoi]|uniref:separase n=1 Tax=Cryptosporidium xiaoi TaxID=659607 RepID=A0AAV9Y0Q5_9CRYT
MTKWRLQVHDLLERKRFNELLSFCIIILDNKIEILLNSGIDIFKDGTRVKFSEVETAENLKKIIIKLGSDPYKIKTEKILSKLLQEKATIDWKRVLKTGIDDAVLCFEDINKIFSYISVCCSEISNGKIIIYYMQLFHKIMPYFIIGDFFFLHLNKRRWITERILISSILKVSERILQNKNIEFDEKDFRYSYLLWEICLCNWWKYSKIRLEYSKIPENVGNEILSIFKNSIEIFQLLSKSSITHQYKILLVYNLWFNILELKISSLFGGRIKDVCTISENNAMAFENDKHIVNILKKKISILIDNGMYDNILDMLTYFNIFTGIIIGIVHKYIKHIGRNGCDTLFNIEHTEIPPEISILFEEYIIYNEKLLKKDITDLHILKIELCLINCIVFDKTIGFFNNSSNRIIKSESKLNKEIIYSFLLTVGVVNSLLDLVLSEKLLIIIKELLYYQHNTLSKILCIGVLADWNFLRNIDGYASCLIGNVFKKVINKGCESEIDEGLKQYVVKIIIEILSMISGLIENYNNENSLHQIEDISQLPKIAMRIKTFTCEAIIRYIQYMGEITEEYFFIMEKIFEGLFSDKITKDNSKVEIDELVLSFILSISENLLRLSSQLNHKKKFQDSIRISTFGLLSLSNIISIPWIIQNDTFFQGTKEYRDIKVTYDTDTSNENFDPLLTPKNIKSFPQPFETINKNTSKAETGRFWRTPGCLSNGLFEMKNYYVDNHKNSSVDILSTPIVGNGNFEDLQTPFTTRIRNYSISQFKSQTIKRIQISTLNNCKTMTRTKKMELQTEKEYKNEYYDPESMNNDSPDYPIHILLYMLMLEQLVLSMNLFSNENSNDTPVELHRIISLIKDNIGILFSQIDDFSFTFIFNDLEGFSLECEPFRKISKRTLNRSAIQMKRHFNNIILTLVSRFVKTKLLLIDGFTDVDVIDLFPESSGPRNTICRAIWINLELSVYKSCRFGTNKYSKIFKKMVKNGFYSRLLSLFNNAIPFYNETSILVCKSKVEFLNLYNNRINLLEFYSWIINFQKQCIKSDFFIVDIDSFICNMLTILSNLEESINNSELNLKREVYLIEIHTLRIHLLMECKFELRDSLLSWFKESFSVNQEIVKEMNKFFNSSHAFLDVNFNEKCCIDNNLLDISYWITQSQEVLINENDDEYNLSNEMFLTDNNSNLEEIDDDIPIPLGNVKTNKINLPKENRKHELNYTRKTKTQSFVRNNVRFATSGGYSEANTKTMSTNNNNEFKVTEVKILVYNSLKLLDIIEFQGINNIYRAKLLNILLYFFSHCWTFCIKYRELSNSVNKKICDLIDYSLRNIIKTKISLNDEIDNQYNILLINFGVLITKLLYKAANYQKDISSSDDYLIWLEIAHLYNKHLIALIEDKYVLSKTFLSEKLPNSCFGSEAIFKLVVLQIENIHIEGSYIEIFDLLNYLDGLEFPDLSECNIVNIALFARLYRRLSEIFDNSRKPELSLFLILESNKFTQALIQSLDNYINDIRPDLAIFSFNGVSKTNIIGVIIKSLIDLGVSWWKIGEIERSNSIFIRVYNFCREWTRSYINILKILFHQLPILFSLTKNLNNMNNLNDINGLNCTLDSSYALDLNYSIDGINQLMSNLCDIYYYYSQFDGCNDFNFSDEKIILMIIIYLLFYSSINSSENVLNRLKKLDFIFPDENTIIVTNNDFAMCLVLKKILRRIISTKNNDIDILLNIFLELNFGIDDYYFNIFYMTILNYALLITSSKYIDSVAVTIEKNKKAAQFKTSENVSVYLLLNNILDDEARHQPNFNSCKINSIAKELIKKATDVKSTFFNLFKADFKNCMEFNRNIGLDEYIFNTLSLLLDKHRNPGKNFNTKIKILKEINELFDVILHYIIFCFKHNALILVNNIISIVIDLILLISSLTYPVQKLISAFSDITSSLINLLSIYNPSLYIHSMRKIQKIFENYKKKESKEHVICCFETLNNKVFFNNLKYISSFILKLDESKTNIKNDEFYLNDIIPRIHIRFSSFFSTFSSRIITEKTKFSLFQITRDISISKNIKQNVSSVRRKSDSFIPTNLTVFYFVESSKICNLLGSFYEIQRENILSIIDVDVNQKSSRKARDWWSRRINLELKLEAWLSLFTSVIFKNWTTKLLFGFPKQLSNSKYNSRIMSYLDDSLKGYKSIGIFDIVLYSLLTNTPNLISLLNYITITNFDFSMLYEYFNKTILRGVTKCDIKNYPVIIFPDKLLMNIPIEGISELLLQPITRGLNSKVSMDNFIYLMNKIGNKGNNKCLLAKMCNIYYFINPSGDLSDTEKIIVPAISKLFKEGNCIGISNSIPQPVSMMNEININSTNLYLFCGHQAGEKFIKGESIERGITTSDSLGNEIFNFPPSLLIGCSSSRIRSYETNDIFCTPLYYLIGGSPFILGALWDVTDQDIDRFTLSIFDNWFKSNLSLLESITVSRRSCKLPLLNGSSCVCFGHPL